ncbi:hypothetical protein GTY88_19790 [Streptomyces sp. SID5926]|nr:hypothetical protein [Streptomyces sp. SID5926]
MAGRLVDDGCGSYLLHGHLLAGRGGPRARGGEGVDEGEVVGEVLVQAGVPGQVEPAAFRELNVAMEVCVIVSTRWRAALSTAPWFLRELTSRRSPGSRGGLERAGRETTTQGDGGWLLQPMQQPQPKWLLGAAVVAGGDCKVVGLGSGCGLHGLSAPARSAERRSGSEAGLTGPVAAFTFFSSAVHRPR